MGAHPNGVLFAIGFEIIWLLLCLALAGGILYTIAYLEHLAAQHKSTSTPHIESNQRSTFQAYRLYIIIGALLGGVLVWSFTFHIRGSVTRKLNSLLFSRD